MEGRDRIPQGSRAESVRLDLHMRSGVFVRGARLSAIHNRQIVVSREGCRRMDRRE